MASPDAPGVHIHQTDAPPGSSSWSGSPASALAPTFDPSVGNPVIGVASAKLSLAGAASAARFMSIAPASPKNPSTTILYSVPAVARKLSRLRRPHVSSLDAKNVSAATAVPV